MITREQAMATVDHSILGHCCTREQVEKFAREVVEYGFRSICVNGANVAYAAELLKDKADVAAVVSFPQGAGTTAAKIFEAIDAIRNGASEVDVVINFPRMKDKDYDYVKNEIVEIVKAVKAEKADVITKFIIYMPYDNMNPMRLTHEEIRMVGRFIIEGGGDFIKYNEEHDFIVETFKEDVEKGIVQLKWSGCPDIPMMVKAIEQGVTRIGQDSVVIWMKNGGEDFWK